ncbi:hypothetical protein ACQE3D_17435 [Methylomonas sp. MS20]|uniref:hypothetical protein n=1 Tax=Methylomonas sp. MS20 TaxID=3418769 RepID=UPI003D08AA5E
MSKLATIDAVINNLKQEAMTLEQIWQDYGLAWQQLGWNMAQVKLWLLCQPSVHIKLAVNGEQAFQINCAQTNEKTNLGDELVALLEKAGRPMPLSQLISKLPAGRVVTEPMLRAAAQHDARLELKGPLLKLA